MLKSWESVGDREREYVGVGVYVGKERVQGFKKVQTRLIGMLGTGKESVWGKRGFKGSKKVQTRLTALVQGFKEGSNKVQRNAGDRERECVGVGVCGEKEKKLKC
jgi:hypothetical protein